MRFLRRSENKTVVRNRIFCEARKVLLEGWRKGWMWLLTGGVDPKEGERR